MIIDNNVEIFSPLKKGINVLSLFDGMSCGQIALERAGIKVNKYYAAEIDKYAIKITQKNYPKTVQLGDITKIKGFDFKNKIDIIIGGSPCQGFSFAGDQLNFEDPRSKLFFDFARLLREIKPKYFLLENVVMRQEIQDAISDLLGEIYPEAVKQTDLLKIKRLEPVKINSALVSAQNRKRLYWTNIKDIKQPEDKKIFLKDILETKELFVRVSKKSRLKKGVFKSSCLTAGGHSGGNHSDMDIIAYSDGQCKRYSVIECERLQAVPDNYTAGVSKTQRYKMLGNGWTVDVIAHIFKNLKVE